MSATVCTDRNTKRVRDDETAFEAMQRTEPYTNDKLGVVAESKVNGERRYLRPGPGPVWVTYKPVTGDVTATKTDDVLEQLNMFCEEKQAIVPVETMPFWGDGSVTDEPLFE